MAPSSARILYFGKTSKVAKLQVSFALKFHLKKKPTNHTITDTGKLRLYILYICYIMVWSSASVCVFIDSVMVYPYCITHVLPYVYLCFDYIYIFFFCPMYTRRPWTRECILALGHLVYIKNEWKEWKGISKPKSWMETWMPKTDPAQKRLH